MDRITLRNMRFFTHVGCTSEERRVGQHLEVDVEFHMDLREAGTTDRITSTINYAEAYQKLRAVIENLEANLLETIAERAAGELKDMGAQHVVVRVRKHAPPIPGAHADYAEVEIRR
jgi:dihydroneopterin aldolase